MGRRPASLALLALAAACSAAPERPWQRIDLTTAPFAIEQAAGVESEVRVRETVRSIRYPVAGRAWGPPAVIALQQPTGSRFAWRLRLGAEPYLSLTPLGGLRPECRGEVRAALRDGVGAEAELLRLRLVPLSRHAAAERELDLERWAGQEVDVVLEVLPAPGEGGVAVRRWRPCRALWGAPAVYTRRGEVPTPPADPRPPNVLLLGLDTYRADRWTSRPAGAPSLTPALDRLAMESDVWLDAYSTFNNTNPSFTSIHTGLYGRSHGIYDLVTALPGEHVTLAERFDAAGYATLAVFAASHLRPAVSGLGQGFDDVRQPEQHSVSSAGMVVDRALEWIDGRREPFFAWLHLFDVHTPTLPPEPYASGWRAAGPQGLEPVDRWRAFRTPGPRDFLIPAVGGHPDLYDGEAAYLDRQLDRLLGFLASRGLLERTFVVVVADHGESLGEHDLLHTHVGLYEPSVHVPLVVRWPDGLAPRGAAPGAPRGRTFRGLVQTVDLYPSLLAAAGLVAPGDAAAGTEGGDLWEWSGTGPGGDGEPGRGLVIAEHANGTGAMIRTRRYKYIWMYPNPHLATGPYLFDLAADPGEETNLAGRGLAVEGRLAAALEAWRQGGGGPATTRRTPGDEELRSLRALGYVD